MHANVKINVSAATSFALLASRQAAKMVAVVGLVVQIGADAVWLLKCILTSASETANLKNGENVSTSLDLDSSAG